MADVTSACRVCLEEPGHTYGVCRACRYYAEIIANGGCVNPGENTASLDWYERLVEHARELADAREAGERHVVDEDEEFRRRIARHIAIRDAMNPDNGAAPRIPVREDPEAMRDVRRMVARALRELKEHGDESP